MSGNYTPAPWTLKSDPLHFDTLSSIVGGKTSGMGKRFPSHELHVEIGGFADVVTQEANSRLISASPELLEALEMLMPQAPRRGECDEYDRAMWDNAALAIAKAKGDKQ